MSPFLLLFSFFVSTFGQLPNCNGGANKDRIISLPGYPAHAPSLNMYSGFIQVNATANGSLFYWFIESQTAAPGDTNTPILVWLNGGPGASSMTGLFAENGPFRINSDGRTLSYHQSSWTVYYHMLFIDNPIDTGFSYCNKGEWVQNEDQMGEQFVNLLNIFFSDCHTEFLLNPLYITGESYAGRYIPFIAKWIYNKGSNLNFKGLAIGDGHYDPNIMFRAGPKYAYLMGIIDENTYNSVIETVDYCLNLTSTDCSLASDICLNVTNNIYAIEGGNIFQYNILDLSADVFDTISNNIGKYLAQPSVGNAIHTYGIEWKSSDGTSAPNPVFDALKCDIVYNNSAELIPLILGNDTRILFYNGQFDGSVWGNGQNQACLNQFNYKGDWITLPRYPYYVYDDNNTKQTIGYSKQSADKLLTYFVISDSGHLVPYDQPENSLIMIKTFIDNNPWH